MYQGRSRAEAINMMRDTVLIPRVITVYLIVCIVAFHHRRADCWQSHYRHQAINCSVLPRLDCGGHERGRHGMMQAWGAAFGASGVGSMSKYCLSNPPVHIIVIRPERSLRKYLPRDELT
ncbi:hypothetical protein BDR04DRAFT_749320 [Suillus decipiens]|nr:hypothetical protein BDR04DRAFT_749320 [Suillus decipiens]